MTGMTSMIGAAASSAMHSAPLEHALQVRAMSLAHGIDTATRPSDVAAVARRVWGGSTRFGLDAADAVRLRSLMARAIEGQPLRVQTVVDAREAEYLLQPGTDRRLRTIYDAIGSGVDGMFCGEEQLIEAAAGRAAREVDLGLLGTGTTIYGRVRIGEVAHTPMLDPGAARTIRLHDPHLSTGPAQYGDVSLTLREQVLDRATFTSRDTGLVGSAKQVGAREQLADVLSDAITGHFMGLRAGAEGTAHPFGPSGIGQVRSGAELRRSLKHLIDAPDDHAIDAIRQHLRSAAMDTYYVEAQVRSATAADIEHVSARAMRRRVDPADLPEQVRERYVAHLGALDALPQLAARRGIGYHASDGPLP